MMIGAVGLRMISSTSPVRFQNVCPFLRMMSTKSSLPTYETLALSRPEEFVVEVLLNRPESRNSLSLQALKDLGDCFEYLRRDEECRAVVLSGAGKTFCAGIDVSWMGELASSLIADIDVSRKAFIIKEHLKRSVWGYTAIEKCPKPVIVGVHGGCIGAGVSLITACDIRYATEDSFIQIKEVDMGMQPGLQRMQKCVHADSLIRELAFTGRRFEADEAFKMGLVSRILPSHSELMEACLSLAKLIATKSPVAVQGTKINLNYSRDRTVDEGLEFGSIWNMCHIQSEDTMKSVLAAAQKHKGPIVYSKL